MNILILILILIHQRLTAMGKQNMMSFITLVFHLHLREWAGLHLRGGACELGVLLTCRLKDRVLKNLSIWKAVCARESSLRRTVAALVRDALTLTLFTS